MEKQDFLNTIASIGTCEDEVQRRELLSTLTDEATALFESNATLTADNEKLKTDNENVRQANMKLYLKVEQSKEHSEMLKDSTGIKGEEPPKKRKYEDLFNENGGLK